MISRRGFVKQMAAAPALLKATSQTPPSSAAKHQPTAPPTEAAPKAVLGAELFPLSCIELLDGPLQAQQERNRKYLLKLEPERLLSYFRREAGMEPLAPPYRGWESEHPNLNGHILGFYMSGAAMMVEATGDETLKQRLLYIAEDLQRVQETIGSGILMAVPGGRALFKEIAQGNFVITNAEPKYGFQINGVFEPTYTWNKVTLGLYEVYRATGSPTAKAVLLRTADWFGHDVLDHLSKEQIQRLLFCEHGSISESMVNAYSISGDEKYLRWSRQLCFDRVLEPLAAGDGDFLDGYHANCTIPVFTSLEAVYQNNREEKLHRAAVNFLNEVIDHRSWVIGGNSAKEHFFPRTRFREALQAPAGPESCNSVNVLRLIERLYRTDQNPRYLDHYERILWNHLMAVHDPERGMFAYYTPLLPGTYRVYSDEFDSMWCCVGTGLECPGKYGQMIYTYRPTDASVDVNLFAASRLNWAERRIVLRQETRFPEQAGTTLVIEQAPAAEWTLRIRHPWWVPAGQLAVSINGERVAQTSEAGKAFAMKRLWRKDDTVHVAFPMPITTQALPGSQEYVALLAGPIVISAALDSPDLSKYDFWQISTTIPTKNPPLDLPALKAFPSEGAVLPLRRASQDRLEFVGGRDVFTTDEIKLIPFYRNHFARYMVYWPVAGTRAAGMDPISERDETRRA